ncbi:nickel pincer cofactor biosynthesis protein LarB [Lujinxingia litoralis]|uniref:Nickel pincer cofactor biosynthesis protein LarB n=1 Tax=Lujinxingia litoralis TaxID=2211119 RepID=A0A328C5K8_9DELT|nr:nickel pincer cofactor biosynthesis protein LarB [Lujinxingia litoralis]RAL22122.1 nickel pincer cofactor biosynthesis protein LarB [Lujinxingia litoralis]
MSEVVRELLRAYRDGEVAEDEVVDRLVQHPFEEHLIGRFDHMREARTGIPEAILAEGKDPVAVAAIVERYAREGRQLIATRVTEPVLRALEPQLGGLQHYKVARIVSTLPAQIEEARAEVCVISAGALDRPVAEEVAVTSRLLGNPTREIFDVGVAGLNRLMGELQTIEKSGILVVVAGMDGALPSVIGGLASQPVIAVPTSVGYGASFKGVAALLTMLNACSPGTGVMNIDNGFGAAVLATKINQFGMRRIQSMREQS